MSEPGTDAQSTPAPLTAHTTSTSEEYSLVQRWYVAFMMCLVYTLSITDRYSISTVLEPIRRDLHLSDANVAFLTGVSLALFYVAFGFPLSWLIDRFSRRNIIGWSLVAWSVLTTATGLARNYGQLLAARIGVGVGEAGGTPGANSLLSDYFPPARRPMALQIFALGAPIGAWLGSQIAGALAYRLGWRAMFLVLGIPGLLAGALIFFTIREPKRGRLDAEQRHVSAPPIRETLQFLWRQRSAVHVMAAGAVVALWGWGLMWWTPTFLIRAYGLNVGQAGAILGPVHLIGGSLSMLASTWLLSRPYLADSRRIMRLLGIYIAVATVVTGIMYSTHSLLLFRCLLWVYVPALYIYIGASFGVLNNLAQPRMRAVYCATTLFIANVANLVIAPEAVGMLSDWFAPHHHPDAHSLRLALLCLVPTGFWASWHFFRSTRHLLEDERLAKTLPAQP